MLDYVNLMITRIRLEVFKTFRACLAASMVKTIFYRLIDFLVQGGRVELAFSQRYEKNDQNMQGRREITVTFFIFLCITEQ